MTALTRYQRLEAAALWREHGAIQRRDVIVSLGNNSLIITDTHERPLTHWSLAAIKRDNPGKLPAIYRPDNDSDEILELAENEHTMVEAIEKLCRVIDRRRPKKGRVRWASSIGIFLALAMLMLMWLPVAVRDYALRVLPNVTNITIGSKLFAELETYTGRACSSQISKNAVSRITQRILGPEAILKIVPQGVQGVAALPGEIYVANRNLVEDFDDPDTFAGFLLAAKTRQSQKDIMRDLLVHSGTFATVKLLTSGQLPNDVIESYAQTIPSTPPDTPSYQALIDAFLETNLSMAPYTRAIALDGHDVTAFTTAQNTRTDSPIVSLQDSDWVSLQGICGG